MKKNARLYDLLASSSKNSPNSDVIMTVFFQITWVDNDGGVLTQGVNYTVQPMLNRKFIARRVEKLFFFIKKRRQMVSFRTTKVVYGRRQINLQ